MKTINMELERPCRQCPWRKDSLPGWLGDSTPQEFLQQAEAEVRMPCHITVDYEDEDWQDTLEEVPHCRGRADYFANRCKAAKNPEIPSGSPNESVFTSPQEFFEHHGGKGQVMILGALVKVL